MDTAENGAFPMGVLLRTPEAFDVDCQTRRSAMFSGKKLLADLIDWKMLEVSEVYKLKGAYREIRVPKKGHGVRIVYEPHELFKTLQRKILQQIISRFPLGESELYIYGSVPNRSWVDNAFLHANAAQPYTLCLDLEDCFPTITREYLKQKFKLLFAEEIAEIAKGEFPNPTRFPSKRVAWFRKVIRKDHGRAVVILAEFIELLLDAITWQGKMVQGAPTSSALLNLIVARSGVAHQLYEMVIREQKLAAFGCTVSVYVDDFAISSTKPFSVALIKELIQMLEHRLPHKINLKKVRLYERNRVAPLITGLRLGARNGAPYVSLPKSEVQRIRGLIHSWRGKPEQEFRVRGYLACLIGIYGKGNVPRQLWQPIQEYFH